jgi:phage major head subunit gpT-like protein
MLSLSEIQKMSESNSWTNAAGKTVSVNQARPQNSKAVMKALWENSDIRFVRESFQKKFGFDFADRKSFPVMEDGFNWAKVANKCGYPTIASAFKEADSGSNFVQVLRAGVQSIVNSMYETVDTTFESWATTVASKKDTELYAPLHGVSFLAEVGKQELYGESRAAGLDIKLKNRKYGTIFAVERELLEDDQTGQFSKQAGLLGEYCKLAVEAIVYAKLAGKFTAGYAQYANLIIPQTETQPSDESSYPWSTALVGGGANRPSSYGLLTQANIQSGFIGLMNQKNLLGLKMSVNPNRIIIGPSYRFDAAVLLNSSFYPSGAASAGAVGGAYAINPIESIAALTVTRFMFKNDGTVNGDSKAWYLVDDKKPFFVTQMRTGPEILQEAPNSGESFNRDVVRFRCDIRCNADHIDPRFAWQGNDGSVTS